MYKIKKNIQYELFLIPALVAYTVFIVVPLTLTLKKWCAIPVNRLIIFKIIGKFLLMTL